MRRTQCYETRHSGGGSLATHRHRDAYAALVIEGMHVETSADGPLACEPGTLLLHPRFHAHGNRFGRGGARVINLPLPRGVAGSGAVAYRVGGLRDAREVFAHAAVDELDALLADAQPLCAPLDGWQRAFVLALRDTDAPAGAIAARVGVSAAHASRALLRSHGMGPQALRRELRWRHALALLHGEVPLADIALLAGFADQSHFNRIARACSGMTPLQLRRQIKSVQDPATPIAA